MIQNTLILLHTKKTNKHLKVVQSYPQILQKLKTIKWPPKKH